MTEFQNPYPMRWAISVIDVSELVLVWYLVLGIWYPDLHPNAK